MHHHSIIELARQSGILFTRDNTTGLLQVKCDELDLACFVEHIISNEREECAKIRNCADTVTKFIRVREKSYVYPFRREYDGCDV